VGKTNTRAKEVTVLFDWEKREGIRASSMLKVVGPIFCKEDGREERGGKSQRPTSACST